MQNVFAITTTLLLLFANPVWAEDSLLERAEHAWNSAAHDELTALGDSLMIQDLTEEERALWALRIGHAYLAEDRPVRAIASFEETLRFAADELLIAEAEFQIGEIYFDQKSYRKALEHYARAIRYYRDADQHGAATGAMFKTAMIHRYNGDAEMAENLLRRIIDSDNVDNVRKAYAMTELGKVFFDVADFDSSRTYLLASNEIYGHFNMKSESLENFEQLIYVSGASGLQEEARDYAAKAADVAIELHDAPHAVFFLQRLSGFFAESGDLRQAIEYREQALRFVDQISAADATALHYGLADLYGRNRRDAEALLSFNDAEYLAASSNLESWIQKIARRKSRFFQRRQRYEEAYKSMAFADSLSRKFAAEELLRAKRSKNTGVFAEESYPRIPSDTRTDLEQQRYERMRNLIVLGLVIFTVVTTLLLREFTQKRKLSKVLEWKVYKRTRELRKANKELNTYIYKSSHDLRTPLTSIKSLLRLLEKEEHNASTRKYLGLISSCTDQMDDILVNLSRAVDYKKVDVRVEQIDFNKLRYQIVEKELANVQGMRVEWNIAENGAFYSDFKLLKVILQQTIQNAIAYRKGTPQDFCKVTVLTDPEGAVLKVEDNGQGISEKVRDKVFEMFVKGTHKSTGAGLGLYLVRIATEKIRATVDLDSEENQGCSLTFRLPNLN